MIPFALTQLPERFRTPKSPELIKYINRKYRKVADTYFRKHKPIEYNPEWKPEKLGESYRWVENVRDGLRFVGAAHDIIRLNHTGWFLDDLFHDETVHGEVYQLPSRNGEPQYVPAVNDPFNDNCACVDFSSVTEDKEDAACWADSMAEQWAEREREYQAKDRAEQRLADIDAEIKEAYIEFRRIAKEIRANCDQIKGIAVVRELVKEKWQRTKAEIHKLKQERKHIEDNDY